MIDTLLKHKAAADKSAVLREHEARARRGYAVLTLHRPANVDDPAVFGGILDALDGHPDGTCRSCSRSTRGPEAIWTGSRWASGRRP